MWNWIKKNRTVLITGIVTVVLCIWLYACESQVKSLTEPDTLVNRSELQLELDTFMAKAEMRMADLDRQDAFRDLIIQNSMSLVTGTPFDPLGLITAVLGIYGVTHAASKVVRAAQKSQAKRKVNNG